MQMLPAYSNPQLQLFSYAIISINNLNVPLLSVTPPQNKPVLLQTRALGQLRARKICRRLRIPSSPPSTERLAAAYVPVFPINYGEISDPGLNKECIVADCNIIHNFDQQITSLNFALHKGVPTSLAH